MRGDHKIQFSANHDGAGTFVITTGFWSEEIAEFPSDDEGWTNAWEMFERLDVDGATKYRKSLAEKEKHEKAALARREEEKRAAEAVYGVVVALLRDCHYLGGHGYPLQKLSVYDVAFNENGLTVVANRREAVVAVSYGDISSVDISGAGETTSGGGFMGGGFGPTGAVEGIGIAALLNTLTTQTSMDTVLHVQTRTGELFFHDGRTAPGALRISLSPVFAKMRERGPSGAAPVGAGDVIDRLATLADLLDRGAITSDEFTKLKADLLS